MCCFWILTCQVRELLVVTNGLGVYARWIKLFQCCALREVHLIEGQNTRDQNFFLCIPFIFGGGPNESWPHMCWACAITTWSPQRWILNNLNFEIQLFSVFLVIWSSLICILTDHWSFREPVVSDGTGYAMSHHLTCSLASHADVLRGSSRVHAPRTSA